MLRLQQKGIRNGGALDEGREKKEEAKHEGRNLQIKWPALKATTEAENSRLVIVLDEKWHGVLLTLAVEVLRRGWLIQAAEDARASDKSHHDRTGVDFAHLNR
jgi:hypothetical protein